MLKYDVIVAGAGPTGLILASELALVGVDVAMIERRPDQRLFGTRAGGLIARTLEMFDQRGIVDRFLSEGQVAQVAGFASIRIDISDFPTRFPHGLGLRQKHIERILNGWASEHGVPIHRGLEIVGVAQDDEGVEIRLADGNPLRAKYLVGCDGGRSAVRKAAGIEFAGWDATTSSILAEVEVAEEPPLGVHRTELGIHAFSREQYEIVDGNVVFADHGTVGIMVPEESAGAPGEPTLDQIKAFLCQVYGTDFGIHDPSWISRFTDATRQAVSYRAGRVFVAGDAAHVHSPVGGKGLNIGLQDAMNLGWKLGSVVKGSAPDTLLDTYHAERHPVAARVLKSTMAQVALQRTDDRTQALRDVMAELLRMDGPRRVVGAEMAGLDIYYDLGGEHPLVGRRMPDLDLVLDDGRTTRVYELLHRARPVLIEFQAAARLDMRPWRDRVDHVRVSCEGPWELPAIGPVSPPAAALVRPDGHVAWVGDGTAVELAESLTFWFGPPAPYAGL